MNKRKKIKLFQQHFAYIDDDFLYDFYHKTHIININSFIKKYAYEDFKIRLNEIGDVLQLEAELQLNYYKDKSEWLREKMRIELRKR